MAKAPAQLAASVRQRLLNIARAQGKPFDVVLVTFGLERLIYRLSLSAHRDDYILKGGMLVSIWTEDDNRFTRDADFLGKGDPSAERLKAVFAEVMVIDAEDGLRFDIGALRASDIREGQEYGGIRLKTVAMLGTTRIPITIDIGFGDAIAGLVYTLTYPSLLDMPEATIRAYPPETVIAEKFHAIVVLGTANGRMKDYYDLWTIPRSLHVDPAALSKAIQATFARRKTELPSTIPPGLSAAFATDAQKASQWRNYCASIGVDGLDLSVVIRAIWQDLEPACLRRNND